MIKARQLTVRGKNIIVYDLEFTMMMIKDWSSRGMSRVEIEDLLLS